ncbi:MAG: MFS transporter [Paracoccaceae bacterium]
MKDPAPPSVLDGPYAWRRLAISLLAGTIGNVGMWAVIMVLPAVQAEFGGGRADASLPYTMTMAGFAAGNLLIGRWVDRWGATPVLIAAALALGVCFTAAAAAPSAWILSALHLPLGFATAASFAPLIADVSHWFIKRRGIAVAAVASGNYLAGAIWPVVFAGLMAAEGWRAVYAAFALLTSAGVIPLALMLRRRPPEEAHAAAETARAAMTSRVTIPPARLQWLLALAGLGCCIAMAMPQVHIVALCVDLGYGAAAGAEMLSLMLAAGVISRLASGLLADKLGGVRTLLIGSVGQCLALFLYLPFDGLASLYLVSLVFGLSQGGIVPSYAVVVREYMPAKEAGARVGFVIMATIVGMAAGGWMSGWIYDLTGSYEAAFLNGIAWNFLNIGIMATLLLRSGGPAPRPAAAG